MIQRIFIFDTTLRDGEQTPGVNLNKLEKLEIAKQLDRLGVDVIEAGFPVASNGDFEAVKLIAQNVKRPIIAGLARAVKGDIDRAWEALKYAEKPRIHTFIATSDLHMKHKLNMSPDEVLNRAAEMVRYAKSLCNDIEFSPEDGTRTNPEFLYKVLEAVIDAGATVVNIPDTVGYTVPNEFGAFIRGIRENVPNIDKAVISVHCHNDLGLAVANSIAAIENGASQVECAVNGLGERAGNAALEEVVMALRTRRDLYKIENDITTEQIHKTSELVRQLTGIQIQPNKAIVGANAFAHESGIHQHGVLNCRETYEIMTPESIGLKKSMVVLGKHSGTHAFEQRLKELGYNNLSAEKVAEAFQKFKELADRKKEIHDEDIESLIRQEIVHEKEVFQLESFHISSGNNLSATATVRIRKGEEIIEEAAVGEGPINAAFKAIDRAVNIPVNLKDYFLKSITGGTDALGEVSVKVENNEKVYTGRGISIDIIEASAKAYLSAINRMVNDSETFSIK
ncbi:2-isopropylmalate synthase [Clostridium sp. SYSU_GA19001]|uniref:2-isopropylmalate synthase n=1 Tax=Clostridium caldaquaticum TaxID=2940653 RepID=UPI002077817B|nr:2-isopropylmalate synthase [Clostridium caldaquaticum]MCM8710910.1 2-isopropylmalate synthase [Clostridium caldaquaticum]